MTQHQPISMWDATAREDFAAQPLDPSTPADVLVVGGGYTGLSTALHCAERGLSVQLLEAKHIGYGGSGRNAGLVNAAAWLPPAQVRSALGDTYGARFVERFGNAPQAVFDLIERHQIRCDATKTGTIHAAHAASGLADLTGRQAEWQRLGAPVELLSRDEIAERAGSTAFVGGLLDRRAGTINPMGYCRGLARAAQGAGARIAEGVRVTGLRREGAVWRATTDQGEIAAKTVVLGTNAYTDALWPGLRHGYTVIHYLQMATTPLGPEAEHILPGRQGLWDTGKIMFSVRRDAENRLVLGTMGRIHGTPQRGLTRRWADRQIARVFPELGPVAFEQAWHGQIAMTPEHLPRIHRLDAGLWTAIGYNGRGITTGTVFGQAMADLLTGMDPAELPLPLSAPQSAPRAGLSARFYDLAFTANQAWKALW